MALGHELFRGTAKPLRKTRSIRIGGFFSQFFVHFALDKQLPAVEAIKASFAFVNQNLGTLIGFYLATIVAAFVGALLCGVGLLVAIPVIIIGQAYTYRVLQGEPVAP